MVSSRDLLRGENKRDTAGITLLEAILALPLKLPARPSYLLERFPYYGSHVHFLGGVTKRKTPFHGRLAPDLRQPKIPCKCQGVMSHSNQAISTLLG